MNGKLAGARIWLSGSFPKEASPDENDRVRKFVEVFSVAVFREGGTIVHGSHPDIRGSLLTAAEHFKSNSTGGTARAPLGLYVSKFFSKSPDQHSIDLVRWRDLCGAGVVETDEATRTDGQSDSDVLPSSLDIMRQAMVTNCNVIVAIGGRWWNVNREAAGVAQEIELAKGSQLPLFLVGGVGQGAVAGLLKEFPELIRDCANGLSLDENERLAAETDPTRAAGIILDQLSRLHLREVAPQKRPFRILCLDGGGIRGAYSAAVLSYLETAFDLRRSDGPRLANHFDLIAGTSTGGILAIGLGLGMTAKEMQSFYVDHGQDIFGTGEGLNAWWHSIRHWFTSKFDQGYLQEQLAIAYATSPVAKRMDDATRKSWMDNAMCHLLVATYNTETDTPHFFRTPHARFKHTDRGNDPVIVALASAAAPTYFAPVTAANAVTSFAGIDGGVWANSPVSVALAEAVAELGASLDQIRVLSIGTTYTAKLTGKPMQLDGNVIGNILKTVLPKPFSYVSYPVARFWPKNVRLHGIAGWVANIASLLMKTQSQTSDIISRQLLGERYLRIDSVSEYDALDDVANTNHFINLGEGAAKDAATLAKVHALFIGPGPT